MSGAHTVGFARTESAATTQGAKELQEWLTQFNEDQRKVILSESNVCVVVAGPGCGKTRTIVGKINFYLRYLQSSGLPFGHYNISAKTIIGLAFTNKAAKEMQERVSALSGLVPTICTYHGLCARLLRQYGSAIGIESDFLICDDSPRMLREIVARMNKQTSHGSAAIAAPDESTDEDTKSMAQTISQLKRLSFIKFATSNFKFPQVCDRSQSC